MQQPLPPRVPKWPFFLSDAVLLATAGLLVWQDTFALGRWEILGSLACVILGAYLAVLPFVLEYKGIVRLTEAATLETGLARIQHAEAVATRIAEATDNWQAVNEAAGRTAAGAREITDRMAAEVREFTEFLKKTNDSEKATLRLEVEKLRRGEGEWVQIVVRMLDHVHALHAAGQRSGQPRLIEQLTQFLSACRDIARRAGLVPFVAAPGTAFDAQRHQTADGKAPPPGAQVTETVATGFTFQGRTIRPASVLIGAATESAGESTPPVEPAPGPQIPPAGPQELRIS
jgi:molecular chaperone GrpE (heat shock protein)